MNALTLADVGFFGLATVTLVGALGAVTLRNLPHALLALVVFFFGVAALFFTLRADFIGVVQILVYVGAVAVLIVFAIVLTRSGETSEPRGHSRWLGALAAAATGGVLVAVLMRSGPLASRVSSATPPPASVADIGESMLTAYALPFELASILLTAALIGAAVIAMDEVRASIRGNPGVRQ